MYYATEFPKRQIHDNIKPTTDRKDLGEPSPSRPETPYVSCCAALGGGVLSAGRDFCRETSMHGFNHIAAPRRLGIERLLWLVVTAAAVWGAVDVSLGQWQRFNESPTVVTLEKDFRSWKYPLPGVTICANQRADPFKVQDYVKATWDLSPGDTKYNYYVGFVETVANSDLLHLEGFLEYAEDDTLNVDLFKMIIDVQPDLIIKVQWFGAAHAPRWVPVMTEAGVCHTINTLPIVDMALAEPDANDSVHLPLSCKYGGNCYVLMEFFINYDFYVHSPYDVMDITEPPSKVILTLNRKTELSVTETIAGVGVRELSVRRRGCLYVDEPVDDSKKAYSATMCRRTCRNRLAIDNCECKPFYNFYEEGAPCSPAGMACLSRLARELAVLKCPCMVQCNDAVYKELWTDDQYWNKGPFMSRAAFRLIAQAPQTRYTRVIVFYFQDLVVSFGGATGLFLGASFLSLVEIVYFVMERIFTWCWAGGSQGNTTEDLMPKRRVTFEEARVSDLDHILQDQKRFS